MNSDGSARRRLTFGVSNQFEQDQGATAGRWSWDGTKIVYARFIRPNSLPAVPYVHLMNADGRSPVRLGSGGEAPAFSPDGQKILFIRCFGSCRLWTMNPDGTGEAELTTVNNVGHATYSPDGSKILFHANPDGGAQAIYTVNANGTNLQLLAPLGLYPEFSPDGTKIAFIRNSDIFVMNADASNQVNVTNSSASEFGPHWSTNGSSIIYSRDGDIFSIGVNGQNTIQLTATPFSELATDVRTVPRQTRPTPFDFNGDGRTDVSVFRPSNNIWYVRNSAGFSTMTWGESGDKLAPADYDNDRKTDIAIWRPSTGTWYIVRSQDMTFTAVQWGATSDYSIPGDYNGDGRADLMVYRPSQGLWYLKSSTAAGSYDANVKTYAYGTAGDLPMSGDFDGDTLHDIAIYRPSTNTWYLRLSNGGSFNNFNTLGVGVITDVPAPADFDGDGITDCAVWRPINGLWSIRFSSNGTFVSATWGVSGDKPVPADYNGDGRAEMAVFRPSNATWYMLGLDQSITVTSFGESADQPVPNALVPNPLAP